MLHCHERFGCFPPNDSSFTIQGSSSISCQLLLSFHSSDSLHLTGPCQAGISRQRPQGSTQRAPLATHGPQGKGDIENLQEEICTLVPLQSDWLKDDARDRNSEMKAHPPSTFHSHNLGCTSHSTSSQSLNHLVLEGREGRSLWSGKLAPCPSHLRWEVAGRAQKGRDGVQLRMNTGPLCLSPSSELSPSPYHTVQASPPHTHTMPQECPSVPVHQANTHLPFTMKVRHATPPPGKPVQTLSFQL